MRAALSLGVLFALAGTFLLAQHGSEHTVTAKSYVGKVAKGPGEAMIGIVIDGDEFIAYLCSNDEAFSASHSRWFRGMVGKHGALQAEVNGVKFDAKVANEQIDGTVTGSGEKSFAFTATAAKSGGLYRGEVIDDKDHYVAGWVQNGDGAIVGGALKNGKQTAIKPPPPSKAKSPPTGVVGLGKKVTGTLVDEIGFPLPGQIVKGSVTAVDAKKKTFSFKTDDGKTRSLPADNLVFVDAKGNETPVDLGNPTPFLFGGRLTFTRECTTKTVTDKNGKTTETKKCKSKLSIGVAT